MFFDHCDTRSHELSPQEFRSESYNHMVLNKWRITHEALVAGANVFLCGSDVVWLMDPLSEIFLHHENCDVSLANDDLLSERNPTWMNTGVGFFRNNAATRLVIKKFLSWSEKNWKGSLSGLDDQASWQMFIESQVTVRSSSALIPCREYTGQGVTVTIEILPARKFMDFRQWNYSGLAVRSEVFTLHYNWLNCFGQKNKRMRENSHWLVE